MIRRIAILPDIHVPYSDGRTLRAVEKYLAKHRWDELIYLGDLMDFDFISSFNRESARKLEGRRFKKDYLEAELLLREHIAIVRKKNPDCKITYLEGNHEERVQRFLDGNPNAEGYLEVPIALHLDELGVKWIPNWSTGELYKVGKAYFSHGLYTNLYHAKKMCESFGDSVYYGHTHDVQTISVAHRAKRKTHEGHSLGCLCREDQSYMKGKPNKWQQAFGVMYVMPDGYFNMYCVRIFNHRFISPDGVVYEG